MVFVENALGFGLEGFIFSFFLGKEGNAVDVFGELRETEIDEFHFLFTAKGEGAH